MVVQIIQEFDLFFFFFFSLFGGLGSRSLFAVVRGSSVLCALSFVFSFQYLNVLIPEFSKGVVDHDDLDVDLLLNPVQKGFFLLLEFDLETRSRFALFFSVRFLRIDFLVQVSNQKVVFQESIPKDRHIFFVLVLQPTRLAL